MKAWSAIVVSAVVLASGAPAIPVQECNGVPTCDDPSPMDVAAERITLVDSSQQSCAFAPTNLCPLTCDCMSLPAAWNHSPYLVQPDVRRAVVSIHGSGEHADFAKVAAQQAADDLELPDEETLIIAPQFPRQVDIDGTSCLQNSCVGGLKSGMFCATGMDCRTTDVPFWGGGWRYGKDSALGSGPPLRPFAISSYEALDQILRLLAGGNFPNLEQIVVIGHSAGAQYTQRFAAGSQVESQVLTPAGIEIRYVLSAPGRLLYFDGARWDRLIVSPLSFTNTTGDCPPFSDCDNSCYDSYHCSTTGEQEGYGLQNVPGSHYMTSISGLAPANQPYRDREVVYLVGDQDTCPYVNLSASVDCPSAPESACAYCPYGTIGDGCSGIPSGCSSSRCGSPSCGTALQGVDHVQMRDVYKDYLSTYLWGPKVLTLQRFLDVPNTAHSTCCMYNSALGKKFMFDIQMDFADFVLPDGPIPNDWTNSPDDAGGSLVVQAEEIAPSANTGTVAGMYKSMPLGDGLRIRSVIKETDDVDLSGSRFDHHFAVQSDGSIASGYGIAVERSNAVTNDSRVTLRDNGAALGSLTSSFQFDAELELEFAVYPDGRVEGTIIEGADSFAFSFGARTIQSGRDSLLYHTAWSAPGSVLPPRMDFLLVNAVPGSVGTPPGVHPWMTAEKTDPSGSTISIDWGPSCSSAAGHHIVYGGGTDLPAAPGGTFTPSGSECGLGLTSPFVWNGTPSASADPTGLVWWLVLANDDTSIEGSWGEDSGGFERVGPGPGGASVQCGLTQKDVTNPCGR